MVKKKATDTDPTDTIASAMVTFGPAASQAWAGYAQECVRFATDRMQQDIEAQRAFLACKTPMDVMQEQFNYCQVVSKLCADQTTRMFHLMTETAQHTADEATRAHARKYDDIPL